MKNTAGPAAVNINVGIQQKIKKAQELFSSHESILRSTPRICSLLEKLEQNIEASHAIMVALRVVDTCRYCEVYEGGSCCGAGIENRYRSTLLLINLLLGVSLPAQHVLIDSCYFLGAAGCCLKARHVLCVNYLCTKLQNNLFSSDIIKLQNVVGEELNTGFILYEAVRKITDH